MGSLVWNIAVEYDHAEEAAITEAEAHINKDKVFRLWGASHGGVYVPVSESTQPNPRLSHMTERDLITPSGRELTLMNPAYMVRQMMHDYEELYGVKGRITSFPDKLFNPMNRPDDWELEALKSFEQGADEMKALTEINGAAYMRLMRPLFINQACLKCHGAQGYKVGDLRGGVGIAIPMAPYLQHEMEKFTVLCVNYSLIWFVGLLGIYYVFRIIKKRTIERMKLMSRLQRSNAKLEKFSYQDGLTQVANRRMFDALLKREWAAAQRNGFPLSMIMIDIDHFKGYNDGYGHQAGDYCLNRVATVLNGVSKRNTDLFARYGGEEFVLLLPNTSEIPTLELAECCLVKVSGLLIPHEYSDAANIVTISLGVATMVPAETMHASALIEAADQALYRAKSMGRNRVEV